MFSMAPIMAFPAVFSPSPSRPYGAYIASKREVEGLVSRCLQRTAWQNITVNAGGPGQVQTDCSEGKVMHGSTILKKMNPLERLGQPEDMANVVSFLAGPEAAGSTPVCANGRLCH